MQRIGLKTCLKFRCDHLQASAGALALRLGSKAPAVAAALPPDMTAAFCRGIVVPRRVNVHCMHATRGWVLRFAIRASRVSGCE